MYLTSDKHGLKLKVTNLLISLYLTIYEEGKFDKMKMRRISGSIPKRNHATPVDNAYFSGFLDAKARFAAHIIRFKKRSAIQIDTSVVVDSANRNILMLLQGYFGGTITVYDRRKIRKGIMYKWQLRDKEEIVSMIEQILPYLKLKRKQAVLLMQYCKSRVEKIKEDPFVPISKHERELIRTLIDSNRKNEVEK
jgi:hypothetical protein